VLLVTGLLYYNCATSTSNKNAMPLFFVALQGRGGRSARGFAPFFSNAIEIVGNSWKETRAKKRFPHENIKTRNVVIDIGIWNWNIKMVQL
jgi:hypothetical protein